MIPLILLFPFCLTLSNIANPFQPNKGAGAITASGFSENSKVLTLDESNFDLFIDGSVPAFIDFYSPSCGYCRALAPEMEILADAYKEHKERIIIAKVDGTKERGLTNRFALKGFPTLLYFHKNDPRHPITYRKSRTAPEMALFIKAQSGIAGNIKKPSHHFKTIDQKDFETAVSDPNKMFFIEFTMPTSGHCKKFEPIWAQLDDLYRNEKDLVIAQIDVDVNRDMIEKYKIQSYPTMVFFPKGHNKEAIPYGDYWILESLVMFLNEFTRHKRRADGTLAKESGIMREFDEKIKSFCSDKAASKDRQSIIAQVGEHELALTDPALKSATRYYVKVMEKIDGLGTDFIPREVERLSALINQKSILSMSNWEDLQIKRNVLKQFAMHAGIELPSDEPKSYLDDMPKITEVPREEITPSKEAKKIEKEGAKEEDAKPAQDMKQSKEL